MIRRHLLPLALLLIAALLPPAVPPARAAARTLSDLGPTAGEVRSARLLGDRIIYIADYDAEQRFDLYSAPLGGGQTMRLSAALPAGEVVGFARASDNLLFSHRASHQSTYVIYSVPLAGGEVVRLAPPPAARPLRYPRHFFVAGDRLLYASYITLFSLSLRDGTWMEADFTDVFAGYSGVDAAIDRVVASANGAALAYEVHVSSNFSYEWLVGDRLYTHVDGREVLLTPEEENPADRVSGVGGVTLAPDGSRVVYTGWSRSAGLRLISVAVDGADEQTLASAGQIEFALAPDNRGVVFTSAPKDGPAGALMYAPLDGSAPPTPLAADVLPGQPTLSPAGDMVYFRPAAGGLARVPLAGGPAETVLASGAPAMEGLAFSADGAHLIFAASDGAASRLYSYATAGDAPARPIDDPALSAAGVGAFRIAGGHVAYLASAAPAAPPDLYSVPLGGGVSLRLGAPGPDDDLLVLFDVTDSQVLYAFGKRISGYPGGGRLTRLLRAPADGSAPAQLVDRSRAVVGDVGDFAVSEPDGRAVYLADQEVDGLAELYSAPLAGGPTTKLSGPGGASRFALSPTGGRVVYLGRDGSAPQLYSAPIDGGATPTPLGPALSETRTPEKLVFSADGAQIFFRLIWFDPRPPGPLYRAPASGGAATELDGAAHRFTLARAGDLLYVRDGQPDQLMHLPPHADAPTPLGPIAEGSEVRLSPDESLVFYTAARPDGSALGLVSQPLGGGPAAPLGLASAGESLRSWALTPDGATVVYVVNTRSDLDPDDELRARALAGGPARVLAQSQRTEISFTLAPASERVVYLRTTITRLQEYDFELYSVPLGGGPGVKLYDLAAEFSSYREVNPKFSFLADSQGRHVVFAARFTCDSYLYAPPCQEVYSVPLDGGEPLRLGPGEASPARFAAPDEPLFELSPDDQVIFLDDDGLYVSQLWGGAARIGDALPSGGVERHLLAGDTVVYRGVRQFIPSHPDRAGLRELYAAELPMPQLPPAGFSVGKLSVVEGGAAALEVRLERAIGRAVSVSYRVSGGTARAGVDYHLPPGPLRFAPGETAAELALTLLDRPGLQGPRTVVLSLDAPELAAGQLAATAPATLMVTIGDDEIGLFLPAVRR